MILIQVTPPDPIISAADAKARVPALAGLDDAVVDALVMASTAALDGADGYLGRALGLQTWDLKFDNEYGAYRRDWCRVDRWWGDCIPLPLPPLVSVDAVTYLDTNGDEQTWDPTLYRVAGVGGKGRITLESGASWPVLGTYPEALTVRFTAGYEVVPAPIVQAVLLSLGFANSLTGSSSDTSGTGIKRESILNGLIDVTYMTPSESGSSASGAAIQAAAASLLAPYRVFA